MTQTAATRYAELWAEAQNLIDRLNGALIRDSDAMKHDPRNWGYAGSMAEANKHLVLALHSLGGLTAEEQARHGI